MGIFFSVIAIVFVVVFLLSCAQKGNSVKDGLWSGCFCTIIALIGAFCLLFIVNEMRSCSLHGTSSDFYDSPRK